MVDKPIGSVLHGEARNKYGKRSPEYRAWESIKRRCCVESSSAYEWYGGRGIKMCDEWKNSYQAFLAEVGRRPSEHHSIDRIDNSKGYEPGNTRWATGKQQNRNRRNVKIIEHGGLSMTIPEWAEYTGLSASAIWSRINVLGYDIETALTKKQKRRSRRCLS